MFKRLLIGLAVLAAVASFAAYAAWEGGGEKADKAIWHALDFC